MSDYPDFARADLWTAAPLVNERNVLHGIATVHFGPYYVGAHEAVAVAIQTQAGAPNGLIGQINWWQDQAMTTLMGIGSFEAWPATFYTDCLACVGPWVSFDINYTQAAGNVNTFTLVQPRRGVHPWAKNLGNAVLVGYRARNVGAGATDTQQSVLVTSGRATLTVRGTATLWEAALFVVDRFGTILYPVASLAKSAISRVETVDLFLPTLQTVLYVTNFDGGARTFDAGLVATTDR